MKKSWIKCSSILNQVLKRRLCIIWVYYALSNFVFVFGWIKDKVEIFGWETSWKYLAEKFPNVIQASEVDSLVDEVTNLKTLDGIEEEKSKEREKSLTEAKVRDEVVQKKDLEREVAWFKKNFKEANGQIEKNVDEESSSSKEKKRKSNEGKEKRCYQMQK